ncbi:MAG: polymerase subunit sigma-24 [Bradyrhizobium sp.]|nr:polymerase subunit sigma-24 [Bradyrhizobium sp.]
MDGRLNDRRFWARLRNKISGRVDRQDVDDMLHAAYVRLERYRVDHQVDNIEAFMIRAAHNLATDAHRRRSKIAEGALETECADMVDLQPLQDEVIQSRNRLLHVRRGIEALPPRTREVFEMHRLDGLKYREIAERLGISQSAVEKHVAKAAMFLARWAKDW